MRPGGGRPSPRPSRQARGSAQHHRCSWAHITGKRSAESANHAIAPSAGRGCCCVSITCHDWPSQSRRTSRRPTRLGYRGNGRVTTPTTACPQTWEPVTAHPIEGLRLTPTPAARSEPTQQQHAKISFSTQLTLLQNTLYDWYGCMVLVDDDDTRGAINGWDPRPGGSPVRFGVAVGTLLAHCWNNGDWS